MFKKHPLYRSTAVRSGDYSDVGGYAQFDELDTIDASGESQRINWWLTENGFEPNLDGTEPN